MAKEISLDEEIRELKRELSTRERVYPEWSKGPTLKLKPDLDRPTSTFLTAKF